MHMRTKALVLRAVDYKESDKILTLLTQESGKLTASARGCRKKGLPSAPPYTTNYASKRNFRCTHEDSCTPAAMANFMAAQNTTLPDKMCIRDSYERKVKIVMQIYQYTNPMNTILPSPDLPTMKNIDTVY